MLNFLFTIIYFFIKIEKKLSIQNRNDLQITYTYKILLLKNLIKLYHEKTYFNFYFNLFGMSVLVKIFYPACHFL